MRIAVCVLLVLLLLACTRKAVIQPVEGRTAYRVTRADGDQLIIVVPMSRSLASIQSEFCSHEICILQVIRLRDLPAK